MVEASNGVGVGTWMIPTTQFLTLAFAGGGQRRKKKKGRRGR